MLKKKPQILVNVMHFVMVLVPSLKLLSSHDYVCDEQKKSDEVDASSSRDMTNY